MRLAYFTPFAPVRSGISAYSAELLPSLAAVHDVDVYTEDAVWDRWARRTTLRPPNLTRSGPVTFTLPPSPPTAIPVGLAAVPLWRAHDFIPRHLRTPYDLIVYQLGNATCHEFMWPYLLRYPGLVVLHDGQLHHARAHALLRRNRKADYLAEFAYAHPDAPPGLPEFVVAGLQGPVYYMWPLIAAVVRRARAVAVHNPRLADDLREAFPDAAIETIRMGVPDTAPMWQSGDEVRPPGNVTPAGAEGGSPGGAVAPAADPVAPAADHRRPDGPAPASQVDARRAPTSQQAPPPPPGSSRAAARGAGATREAGALRFAAFGLVTPEKRIPQALRALAAILTVAPHARLTLVGETTTHYDAAAEAEALGIADRVEITGYVADEALAGHIAAADVCLCLRWPTARETSASWLRCLAAGKPTIVTDLTHLVDVPTLDPRSWTLLHARADAAAVDRPLTREDAVAVSIDILDEDHSLALAMRKLATDADLRDSLGRAARRLWESAHTLPLMADDYARIIARVIAGERPVPDAAALGLPPHLLEDHTAHGRRLVEPFGVKLAW